jgi:hypothetical protein
MELFMYDREHPGTRIFLRLVCVRRGMAKTVTGLFVYDGERPGMDAFKRSFVYDGEHPFYGYSDDF